MMCGYPLTLPPDLVRPHRRFVSMLMHDLPISIVPVAPIFSCPSVSDVLFQPAATPHAPFFAVGYCCRCYCSSIKLLYYAWRYYARCAICCWSGLHPPPSASYPLDISLLNSLPPDIPYSRLPCQLLVKFRVFFSLLCLGWTESFELKRTLHIFMMFPITLALNELTNVALDNCQHFHNIDNYRF